MNIGETIKKFREEANLSRKEVAKVLNISESGYIHYEKGDNEPKFEYIMTMAKLFNKSIAEFFGEEPLKSDIEGKTKLLLDVINLLKRNGEITDVYFDKLDENSQQMIILAINKILAASKENGS